MNIKKLNYKILILFALLLPFVTFLGNYLFKNNFFEPISLATNELVNWVLIANVTLIIIFSFFIFYIGKHDLQSIRISKQKVKTALKLVFLIWFISQVVAIIYTYFTKGELILMQNVNKSTGNLIGQLLGNALFEEMIYRGIFFLQLYLIFRTNRSNKISLILAIIISQMFFALIHIPNRLLIHHVENLFTDLIMLFIIGIIFSLILIKTDNLAYLIGVHCLINEPFNLIETSFPTILVISLLTIIITLLWNKKTAAKNQSFFIVT